MAKFCKYCGKPLSEGENCTCQEAVAEAQLRDKRKKEEMVSGNTENQEKNEAVSEKLQETASAVSPQETSEPVYAQEMPAQNAESIQSQSDYAAQYPGQTASDQANQGQAQANQGQTQANQGQAQANQGQAQANQGQAQVYPGQPSQGQPYQPSAFSLAAKKAFRLFRLFFKEPDTVLSEAYTDPDKKAQWFLGGVWALLLILTTQIAQGTFVKNLVRQLVWNLSGMDGGNLSARSFANLFSGRAFHKLSTAMAGGILAVVLILILCRFLYAVIVYGMSRKQNSGKSFQSVITLFLTASIPEIPAVIITFIFSLTGALSLTLIFAGLCLLINSVTFYLATEIVLKDEKKSVYFTALIANAGMVVVWAILSGSFVWGLTENFLRMMTG